MEKGRVLAVEIDSKLFDKLDEIIEEEGITKKKYMTELISKDISQEQNCSFRRQKMKSKIPLKEQE